MGVNYSYETISPNYPKSHCDIGKHRKLFYNEINYRVGTLMEKGINFNVKTKTSKDGKVTTHTFTWKDKGEQYKEIYKIVKE